MKIIASGILALGVAGTGMAADPAVFPVWPAGKTPLAQKGVPPEESKTDGGVTRIGNVTVPTLTAYPVAGASKAPAVVVCPGGGYHILAWDLEGTEIAAWLNRQGIAAFILKYRVSDGVSDPAFCDGQRAVSLVRSRAAEFGVDPAKIGIMGFSAGANLSARVSTNSRKRGYAPVDDADRVSCRPDFTLLVYPWALVKGPDSEKFLPLELRAEFPVDSTTPPAFLVQTMDDPYHAENAMAYCAALKAAGVAAELHIFPDGGHGYGVRPHGHAVDGWEKLAAAWLERTLKNLNSRHVGMAD